jgi:PhnB protein
MDFRPYLFVTGGKCEEALKFYKSIFGGDFNVEMRWKDAPQEMGLAAEMGQRIMHSTFDSPAVKLMASDSRPTTTYGDSAVSLAVSTDTEDDAKRIFDALAKGGKVEVPLEKAFWGGLFGMLTDTYGFDWSVNCDAR